ncbi:MAG: lamin tail domain-containing protein [Nocardioides sp.]
MPYRSRVALSGLAAAAVTATALTFPLGSAPAASSDIVISEVYGGGGNKDATYTHDFIELHNTGTAPVDLTGWSVQYASATGASWQRTALEGVLEPGNHYLVQEAAGSGGTTPLPGPNASGSINMSGTAGKVALVRTTDALTCSTTCVDDTTGAPTGDIHDFLGFGTTATDYETAPIGNLSNTTSAQRQGADTDNNAGNFTRVAPDPQSDAAAPPPPPPPTGEEGLEIHDIQGAAHLSPYADKTVIDVPGIVTAVNGTDGFWMQSATPDADESTSEGIYVFRGTGVSVGDSVTVTGKVTEYRPGAAGLSLTELVDAQVTKVASGATVPTTTIVGPGGRVPPSNFIEDDAKTGLVEDQAEFDPAEDGIDFWESLEGMRIGIEDARVTGPSNRFGEVSVVPAGAEPMTTRGGIAVEDNPGTTIDDMNPERVLVDDVLVDTPVTSTGDRFAGLTEGVLDYSFNAFKLLATTEPTLVPGNLPRETTAAALDDELSVASYNVENLSPRDSQAKFDALAQQIVGNLASPDLLTLEEVQDNSGPTNDGVVAADETLRLLTEAVVRAGGPAYQWRQIDPVDRAEGGQPGGNIRVAFLFRTDRGLKFVDRGTPSSTEGTEVKEDKKGNAYLTRSPGRIAPESPAWDDSRVPLAGEFKWHSVTFFAIANHFASKGGSDPLWGRTQPPAEPSQVQRHQQAREVRDFTDDLFAKQRDARIVVAGDINDFDFSRTVDILVGAGDTALTDLPRTLPVEERYTYVFEGNSQVLDHILLSPAWAQRVRGYDIVHVNAEYSDQISDHDPQVVRLTKKVQ